MPINIIKKQSVGLVKRGINLLLCINQAKAISYLIVAFLLLLPPSLHAAVSGTATVSDPTPDPGSHVTVTWNITVTGPLAPPVPAPPAGVADYTLESAQAGLIDQGTSILTSPSSILAGFLGPRDAATPNVYSFVEVLAIPLADALGAAPTFEISRVFSHIRQDGGSQDDVEVKVPVTINYGGGAGAVEPEPKEDAAIQTLTVSPSTANATQGQNLPLSLIWTMATTAGTNIETANVSSSGATLNIGINSKGKALSGSSSSGSISINENVTITAADIQSAINTGSNQLTYSRTFSSGSGSKSAGVIIPIRVISPTSTGQAQSSNLTLIFNDGTTNKTLKQGSQLQAIAEISTTGVGLLSGQWEKAYQATGTGGTPFFTPFQQVQTALGINGISKITSSPLATQQAGTYFVRFNMTNPSIANIPVLQYRVTMASVQNYKIRLISPATNIGTSRHQTFSWATSPNSNQLKSRLQISPKLRASGSQCQANSRVQTRIAIDQRSGNGNTKISPITAKKLKAGQQYCWQVQAFENGRAVATSESRMFIWGGKIKQPIIKKVTTPPLKLIGIGSTEIQITTDPIKLIGIGSNEMQITTDPLKLIGLGENHIQLTTDPIKLIGTGATTISVTTDPIKLIGTGANTIPVTTDPIKLTGTGATTISVTTDPIKLIGTGANTIPVTTDPIKLIGTGANTISVTTDPIKLIGTGANTISVTTDPIKLIGTGANTISVTTDPIKLIGKGVNTIPVTTAPIKLIGLDANYVQLTTDPIKLIGNKSLVVITTETLHITNLNKTKVITMDLLSLGGIDLNDERSSITVTTQPLHILGSEKNNIHITTDVLHINNE